MAALCQTGWGVLCQRTETWIHSLDNLADFLMLPKTTLPNSDFNWSPFVRAGGVYFTCHTNRTFLCLHYLFIGCLSPHSSWGKATQTQPRGRKPYPSKTSSAPHYPFHPQREDTNRGKKKDHPGTNVANNSSVEWNSDAWSKAAERKCSDGFKSVHTSSKPQLFEEFKHLLRFLSFSNNQAVADRLHNAKIIKLEKPCFPLINLSRHSFISIYHWP